MRKGNSRQKVSRKEFLNFHSTRLLPAHLSERNRRQKRLLKLLARRKNVPNFLWSELNRHISMASHILTRKQMVFGENGRKVCIRLVCERKTEKILTILLRVQTKLSLFCKTELKNHLLS